MPIFIYALLGITTLGTGLLVLNKGAEATNDTAQKGIVTAVAALGLYALYKISTK